MISDTEQNTFGKWIFLIADHVISLVFLHQYLFHTLLAHFSKCQKVHILKGYTSILFFVRLYDVFVWNKGVFVHGNLCNRRPREAVRCALIDKCTGPWWANGFKVKAQAKTQVSLGPKVYADSVPATAVHFHNLLLFLLVICRRTERSSQTYDHHGFPFLSSSFTRYQLDCLMRSSVITHESTCYSVLGWLFCTEWSVWVWSFRYLLELVLSWHGSYPIFTHFSTWLSEKWQYWLARMSELCIITWHTLRDLPLFWLQIDYCFLFIWF